jgi:aconitate decarboxylase
MNGNPDPNALSPQRVEVTLRTGETLRWTCDTMLANPARPLTREQHLQKFLRCLAFAQQPLNATGLIELVDRLEEVTDVRALCALLAPQ